VGARLKLRNVRHRRSGREVLRIDSLDIEAGEHVCVLGPNGAGKTTLLRLLAGILPPDSGDVTIDGVSTSPGNVTLRRRVAYATQQPGLLSTSVRRNVELPLRWRGVPRRQRGRVVDDALRRLRISGLAERPARELSGGEQQRVSLARAIALGPAVLLLDEPVAGLDAASRAAFLADLARALADRTATVVQVSHRAAEAMALSDRVIVLVDGQVHQVGAPEELSRSPADASVAALVGYDNLLDAHVCRDGTVLVAGRPVGLLSTAPAGPATVAAFGRGVLLEDGQSGGLHLTVSRVRPGPGLHVVGFDGPLSLVAHVPAGAPVPRCGERVRIVLDPMLTTVLPTTAADVASRGAGADEPVGPDR
jgi:ABC-type sugar transport system ATPase subunit